MKKGMGKKGRRSYLRSGRIELRGRKMQKKKSRMGKKKKKKFESFLRKSKLQEAQEFSQKKCHY